MVARRGPRAYPPRPGLATIRKTITRIRSPVTMPPRWIVRTVAAISGGGPVRPALGGPAGGPSAGGPAAGPPGRASAVGAPAGDPPRGGGPEVRATSRATALRWIVSEYV